MTNEQLAEMFESAEAVETETELTDDQLTELFSEELTEKELAELFAD